MSEARNELVDDDDFLRDARGLPSEIQEKLSELLIILQEDCFDSRLHTKPLAASLQGMFSFRITRDWRVGFTFQSAHSIRVLLADRRDRIYKRLGRKS